MARLSNVFRPEELRYVIIERRQLLVNLGESNLVVINNRYLRNPNFPTLISVCLENSSSKTVSFLQCAPMKTNNNIVSLLSILHSEVCLPSSFFRTCDCPALSTIYRSITFPFIYEEFISYIHILICRFLSSIVCLIMFFYIYF